MTKQTVSNEILKFLLKQCIVSYDTINCIEYLYLVLDTIYFARSKFCPSEVVASTRHAHLTLRVSLRLAKRSSAQFANSTTKVLQTRTTFNRRSRYSPTSSQGRVLVEQASVAAYLTRFTVKFFFLLFAQREKTKNCYRQATYKDNFSTFPQPRIFFGLQVAVFSRDQSY